MGVVQEACVADCFLVFGLESEPDDDFVAFAAALDFWLPVSDLAGLEVSQ